MELTQEFTVEGFRLSPQQARLWLLQQESPVYCVQSFILLEGALNAEVLRESAQWVVNRHDIFRTTFPRLPGMGLSIQVVAESEAIGWEEINLSHLDRLNQQAIIKERLRNARRGDFRLDRQALHRLELVKLSAKTHGLLITMPSMCADGSTLDNLVNEMSERYAADLSHSEALSEEPVQYVQFSEWQNELLDGDDEDELRSYWHKKDFSKLARIRLPFEQAHPEQQRFNPETISLMIEQELGTSIIQTAKRYEVVTSDFMLACWQMLIWRLTGEPEIVVGSLCDGRKYEDLRTAMGAFAKYVPVRCEFARTPEVVEILKQVKQSANDAYEWQEYFVWNDTVASTGSLDSLSFFSLAFDFEQRPEKRKADAVVFSIDKSYCCIDRFAWKLSCILSSDVLTAELHYDSAVFPAEDAQRIAGYFVTLLKEVVKNPEAKVTAIEILTEAERHKILTAFNATDVDYPQGQTIQHLFEQHAAQRPDSIALILGDEYMTYSSLNQRANQLAHYLRRLGCTSETRVAICLERGADTIIALLAVVKAGSAYVPLDPEYPKERLRYMAEDAQAFALLTRDCYRKILPGLASHTVFLDADREAIARQSEQNLPPLATAENLAYVIYTSGTTGMPKGVMIEHRSVANLIAWQAAHFGLTPDSRILQFFSYSFDGAVGETFMALLNGAALLMVDGEHVDPRQLVELMNRHLITVGVFVPSLLKQMNPDLLLYTEMLTVVSVGEACPVQLAQHWSENCDFINGYGPTEGTVYSHTWRLTRDSLDGCTAVAIGSPIHNLKSYVLDAHLNPTPVGVTGEIFIAGSGLARGYLNRQEATAERFLPNGFDWQTEDGQAGGSRMYKTGDLGKYLQDGRIEFQGRIDHQIKLRGFRIELGEIGWALSQHPDVRDVLVDAVENQAGEMRLVAYVLPKKGSVINANQLRRFLQDRLPEYMVPATFIGLDEFPLTPNGKVDRQALPEAEQGRASVEERFVAPRTPIEEVLAGIFSQLLNVERVGVQDNFFELGGHSLLATVVISRIDEAFNVTLPLSHLFDAPSVAGLAQDIEVAMKAEKGIPALPLEVVPRNQPLPLSFSQQRQWIIDQLQPGTPDYNIPAAFHLQGWLNATSLEQSVSEVLRRHEALRTTFGTVQRELSQMISPARRITLPVVDLSSLDKDEQDRQVRQLIMLESQLPFHLSRGPLLRTTLLCLKPESHVVLFTIHHVVFDGWSMGLLVQEIAALLESYSGGSPSSLPELDIQYADFAYWQREWLQGEVIETQLSYWKQQLREASSSLALPTLRHRSGVQTFRGAVQSFSLSGELSTALERLSYQQGVTLFMTLLAAFDTLLYHYTRQDDIVVGTIIANRNHAKLERLIGFFVNTLMLRVDLSGNPTFRELLLRVRRVCLGAYAHQDLPFEKVAEELRQGRDLASHPLFQAMLTLQNNPGSELELTDLELTPLETHSRARGFDFQLNMARVEDKLVGYLHYNDELLDAATISQMIAHFQSLLEELVKNPDANIDSIALGAEAESQELLSAFNDELE
jgi:amino acid adenylation domain-containing protein